jgi:hypothetical protein
MPRSKLALVIPTYCRASLLRHGIERMLPDLSAGNVTLYISDDSPDDTTQQMLTGFTGRLPEIRYRRNAPALRHDRNIVASLLWPDEDYVWILGDAGMVVPGGFDHLLPLIDGQDVLFVNSHAAVTPDVRRMTGETARCFLRDMLWHQTLTGATVYGPRLRKWLRETAPDAQGLTRNFPHLAALVDFVATHDPVVAWVGTPLTRFSPKESYWQSSALSVFVEDWAQAVCRRPDVIYPDEQPNVLRSHDGNMHLFGLNLLADLRRTGTFGAAYLRDHPYIFQVIDRPAWLLHLIARLPVPAMMAIQSVRRRLR